MLRRWKRQRRRWANDRLDALELQLQGLIYRRGPDQKSWVQSVDDRLARLESTEGPILEQRAFDPRFKRLYDRIAADKEYLQGLVTTLRSDVHQLLNADPPAITRLKDRLILLGDRVASLEQLVVKLTKEKGPTNDDPAHMALLTDRVCLVLDRMKRLEKGCAELWRMFEEIREDL